MAWDSPARRLLAHEARALLARLDRLRPFALLVPMVAAAAPSSAAQLAIEGHLVRGRAALRGRVEEFLSWLEGPGAGIPAHLQQQRFAALRLAFNGVLSDLDIFSDAISQRAEHDTGVWLAGLDCLAADALRIRGVDAMTLPPILCYLDRGIGAAVRRALTLLPGGGANPVAVVRIPRERMIGSGIASSLVHEVGHQGAAILGLDRSLRPALAHARATAEAEQREAWRLWERWITEIVPDFWSAARLGVCAPLGLLAVVSLPVSHVFRIDERDPHPVPWARVKLACAVGDELYPHPQWRRLSLAWEALYPRTLAPARVRPVLAALERTAPALARLLATHRPRGLQGETLAAALTSRAIRPERLAATFDRVRRDRAALRALPPCTAFAAIAQARAELRLEAAAEARMLSDLLRSWALRSALDDRVQLPGGRRSPGAIGPGVMVAAVTQ